MAEASPKFYRTQIVLTGVGTLLLIALCAQLLKEDATPAAFGFGIVFCLLIFLAGAMTILRLVGGRMANRRKKPESE